MPIPITVPRLGWNMEHGTLVEWLKADGDTVKPGDMLYRLEGEKSVEEIESFDSGVLSIPPDAPKPGDSVAVGAVLGVLLQPGEVVETGATTEFSVVPATKPVLIEPAASPSVRRMARERGIELTKVNGSGPGGRVTASDLGEAQQVENLPPREPTISPRARRRASDQNVDWKQLCGSGASGRIRERDIPLVQTPSTGPLTATRKAIAARMLASKQATAPVTLTSIVDASNLVNLRQQFKAVEGGVPSFTDFLIKLCGVALLKHPMLAARWTDAGIQPAQRIDIGFAVDTDAGLMVPVLRDVPSLGVRDLAKQSLELIERARSGKISSRDMEGGCFTITNLGGFGIDAFTPIINYPECAILGVGRIERRPVMDGDRVVGREQVTLSLTFDHRIVDGAPAAWFLQTLATLVANPGPGMI